MKVSVVMPVTDAHKMALKKAAPSAEFTFGKERLRSRRQMSSLEILRPRRSRP